jgi:hypothetical protein
MGVPTESLTPSDPYATALPPMEESVVNWADAAEAADTSAGAGAGAGASDDASLGGGVGVGTSGGASAKPGAPKSWSGVATKAVGKEQPKPKTPEQIAAEKRAKQTDSCYRNTTADQRAEASKTCAQVANDIRAEISSDKNIALKDSVPVRKQIRVYDLRTIISKLREAGKAPKKDSATANISTFVDHILPLLNEEWFIMCPWGWIPCIKPLKDWNGVSIEELADDLKHAYETTKRVLDSSENPYVRLS